MSSLLNNWAAMALCGVLLLAGCNGNDTTTPGNVAEGEVPTAQAVTVQGSIERILDARTFTMSGTMEILSDDLVVVSRTDLPVLTQGDEVEVIGTVRNVGHVEIERETNWNFNPQITVELADVTGFLVADSVRVIERD